MPNMKKFEIELLSNVGGNDDYFVELLQTQFCSSFCCHVFRMANSKYNDKEKPTARIRIVAQVKLHSFRI